MHSHWHSNCKSARSWSSHEDITVFIKVFSVNCPIFPRKDKRHNWLLVFLNLSSARGLKIYLRYCQSPHFQVSTSPAFHSEGSPGYRTSLVNFLHKISLPFCEGWGRTVARLPGMKYIQKFSASYITGTQLANFFFFKWSCSVDNGLYRAKEKQFRPNDGALKFSDSEAWIIFFHYKNNSRELKN